MYNGLPKFCAAYHPSTNEPVLLKRGEMGYWRLEGCSVEQFNEKRGITPEQREAMLTGSAFGWDVPGANPLAYEGKLKPVNFLDIEKIS